MIRIMLFAGLAEVAGTLTVTIGTNDKPISIKELREILTEKYPNMSNLLANSMAAVNQEYADPDMVVTSSDEVAFIPPVSGG